MKNVSAIFPEPDLAKLDALVAADSSSRSAVMRKAVRALHRATLARPEDNQYRNETTPKGPHA